MPRGIHMKGRIVPAEIRRKISVAMKGRKGHSCSNETKIKLREINLGKKASTQARKNMSLAHGGTGELINHQQQIWKTRERYRKMRERDATHKRPVNCEVCGIPEIELKKALNFDHDHKTGKFRGWLCGRCNRALGIVGDNESTLIGLAEYLKKSRENGTK